MTLLTICQQVADESGVNTPNQIVGNSDLTAKKLLAAAKSAGRDLSQGKVYNGQGLVIGTHDWSALRKERSFNTVIGDVDYLLTAAGIIPDDDYNRIVQDTIWNRTTDRRVYFVNPIDWQTFISGTVGVGIDNIVTIRQNQLLMYPTPAGVENIAFEYISNKWCRSSAGVAQTTWVADSDVGILREDLLFLGTKWRFKQMDGLPYAEDKLEYMESVHMAMGQDLPLGKVTMHISADYLDGQVPETGYGL
jgi:hypothetical protein